MARSQPYGFACSGGLVDSANRFDLFKAPGVATTLRNFEVAVEGGYRRINGYSLFGGGSSVRPNSSNQIYGLFVYADGVIAASGSNIYFSQDGTSWIQINKQASGGVSGTTALAAASDETLTSPAQYTFALYEGTSIYGDLVMTDASGNNKPFLFRMTGTGALATRDFVAGAITISSNTKAKFSTIHGRRLVVAGDPTTPNTVYISTLNNIDQFTGGSSITLEDQIVGLKSFRNELFIFCKNSIFKLQNVDSSSDLQVVPVTKNVGCLDGQSIQEFGGDLIFLAPDGLRTVAGTARIGDVELGTISKAIQPQIKQIADNIDTFTISSVVLRDKSQYRLYYGKSSQSDLIQEGIIGTLRPEGWQWSETRGIEAPAVTSGFTSTGVEKSFHGDFAGYVYNHDTGNSFNPAGTESDIDAQYTTPDIDYGDLGMLKTLQYLKISFSPENDATPTIRVRYDFESTDTPQPADISIGTVPLPSLFGSAVFNTNTFGAGEHPTVRTALTGSGHSNNFSIFTKNTNQPYIINGLYIDYVPSGRR